MNILLVVPRNFINLKEPSHFPVGMAYISSCLKAKKYNVDILNLNFMEGEVKDILEDSLKKKEYDIVETGGLITHYELIDEIVTVVKNYDKKIYTLVGGGIITGAPEVVMQGLINADFGVIGEGEITNVEVSEAILGKMNFAEVDGLIWRERVYDKSLPENKLVRNKPRKEIADLDSLPWPDYEGFQLDKMLEYAPKKYVTMSTGRSCNFHCTFCFHTSGQTYRQRSLDSFFEELDYLVERYGIDNIYITDELFACNKERLEELCRRIKDYNILWAVQLRVNIVNKPMLQMLKDAGCIIISFGLESADNRVLKSMRKGITVEMIENALQCSYEVGIKANGAFIFGDIAEDKESVNNTLTWWRNHREYNVALNLIQVYPGTYLYEYACKNGIIKDELQFIKDGCPYINLSKLTDEEYKELALFIDKQKAITYPKLQKNIEVEKHKENYRINVHSICENCGEENLYTRMSTANVSVVKCAKCGSRYTLSPYYLYRDNLNKKFEEIVDKKEKIALWGATPIAAALYEEVETLRDMDSIIIDTNNVLWGTEFCDHMICSCSEIEAREVQTVIVCDYTFEMYVINTIKAKYKKVKNILSAADMLGVK